MNPQPMSEEEDYEPKSWWTRVKDVCLGVEETDDEVAAPDNGTATAPNGRKNQSPLRLQTARGGKIAIRLNAQVFEDAKFAADGLKGGEYQIVNLERATPQMAERVIDFLNGVCYALDGTVERVGEKVYMFVPANVTVEVDNGVTAPDAARSRGAF